VPRFPAAFRAALQSGQRFVPIAVVAWPSGTKRYGVSPRGIGGYAIEPRLIGGGTVSGAIPLKPGSLSFPDSSIRLADNDGAITRLLEGGSDPRGSGCSFLWAMPGLPEADWFTLFSGVLDRSELEDGGFSQVLSIRANDAPLQGNTPKAQFLKAEFPFAIEPTWGTFLPIVYGSHSAEDLTGKGMVAAINWRLDAGEGYGYTPTVGHAKAIPRVYKNGTLIATPADYSISYPIHGAKLFTSIDLAAAATADDIITCDIDGIEDVGDGTGELITNPVDQLAHWLANFAFGDWRYGAWNSPTDYPIDLDTFSRAAGFASAFLPSGSMRFGGEAQTQQINDVLQRWFSTWLCFRPYWTETGKLALGVVDHIFHGPTSPGFASSADAVFVRGHSQEIGVSFGLGDETANVVRRIDAETLFGLDPEGTTRKAFQTVAVEDVSQPDDKAESYTLEFVDARVV
jgi:hypothetical protein